MCIAAGEARRKLLQPRSFPSLVFMPRFRSPLSSFLARSPSFHCALYGYVHPESIGRREYTPANPNCWETFQIPLDVCFEFKYRRAFELGRVIQPRANTSRTSLTLLNRASSSASAFADFLSRLSRRIPPSLHFLTILCCLDRYPK